MKEGGFSLRKWKSNSRSFGKRINKDEERKRRETMGISPNEKESLQNHENVYSSKAVATKLQTEKFVNISGFRGTLRNPRRVSFSYLFMYL